MEKNCAASSSLLNYYECNLPEDLIEEILIRLPVKSLLRCKSVCKNWISTITNSSFAKLQFHHSKTSQSLSSSSYIIVRSDNSIFTLQLDLNDNELYHRKNEVIKGKFVAIHPTLFKSSWNHQGFEVLSSFNGILCVHVRGTEKVFLWNPTTNESRLIPSPIGKAFDYCDDKTLLCGFGYDSSSNDYKIVLVASYGMYYPKLAKLYSFRENKWHQIDQYLNTDRRHSELYGEAVLLNDALYWVVNCSKQSAYVLKFDFVNECFERVAELEKIDWEKEGVGKSYWHKDVERSFGLSIGEKHNQLCICDMHCYFYHSYFKRSQAKPDVVEMWVFDDRNYTMKKKFRLQGRWNNLGNDYKLLGITGHGKVVIFERSIKTSNFKWKDDNNQTMDSLLVFDARLRKPFYIQVDNEYGLPYGSDVPICSVVNYVPTLFSPDSLY